MPPTSRRANLMPHRLSAAVVSAALFALPAAAAELDPAVERMKRDIYYLAGEECEGRGIETQGILKAGEYVADSFRTAGLKPGGKGGSYFQPFTVSGSARLGTPNSLTLTGPDGKATALTYGTDFSPTAMSTTGKVSADVVFAGYGITSADKPKYDDYAGLDAKGKVVVVLRRSPRAEDTKQPFADPNSPLPSLQSKLATATKNGAAALIFVNDAGYGKEGDKLMDFGYAAGPSAGIPVLHMTRANLETLLATQGKKLADIEQAIDKDLAPRSLDLKGCKVGLETSVNRQAIPCRNVVAVSEGTGPLADETVVVGAHYDHLGAGEVGSLGGQAAKGKVHYGADDNGSGTTGLLELARRVGAMKERVGRRVVFVAFSAEERGLFGSQHYVKEPPFPLDKTVFMLNLDMVGRMVPVDDDAALCRAAAVIGGAAGLAPSTAVVQKDRLVVYGTGTSDKMNDLVTQANQEAGLKLLRIPGGTGPSDHDSFYRKKIPVLFFFTGTHKDYHRPTDTPDKINLQGIKKAVGLGEWFVRHFAAVAERPQYAATKGGWEDPTDPSPRVSRPNMPKLGIMPGNYEAKDGGVLVEALSPGGAAEKGGVLAQDVIVELAGKPVTNIQTYMSVMAGQKAGHEIPLVVLRKDKKVPLKVVPLP